MPHRVQAITAFQDNYIWMLVHPEHNQVVVVDPGDAAPVLEALTLFDCQLAAILVTHHHHDHVGGITALLEKWDVPVYGPAAEQIPGMTHPLVEGDRVELDDLGLHFDVMAVPGHTLGHIAYYGQGRVFCGDTLFAGGCGRLFEGTAAQLYQSLQRLAALPRDTKVYCAHEYTQANLQFAQTVDTNNRILQQRIVDVAARRAKQLPTLPSTIGEELFTNPFLRCDNSAVSDEVAQQSGGAVMGDPVAVFAAMRQLKDNY